MIQVHCLICNKSFKRQPSQLKYFKRHVCSLKCRKKLPYLNIGSNNGNWNGGKIMMNGYIAVRSPKHPFNHGGYVFEHRLIMEKVLNRYLKQSEVVHHINGIQTDNRRKNLIVMIKAKHHNIENTGQTYWKKRKRSYSGQFI